jgi:hypothetical protein
VISSTANVPPPDHFSFILRRPAIHPGSLLDQAVRLRAPLLLSANALSRWLVNNLGLRFSLAFDERHLGLVSQNHIAPDSADFIAKRRYRGVP